MFLSKQNFYSYEVSGAGHIVSFVAQFTKIVMLRQEVFLEIDIVQIEVVHQHLIAS